MEDFKFILYILAAIAFFLYNTWRKAFKEDGEAAPPDELPRRRPEPQPQPPKPQPHAQPTTQRPAAPPTSFEDILRELQPKAERAKEQARPVLETVKEKVYPEPKPRFPRSYETAPVTALSLEDPGEAREAAMRAQRKRMVTEPYSPWKAAVKTNKYADMLRNPQGLREAIIVSEILQRKYQ